MGKRRHHCSPSDSFNLCVEEEMRRMDWKRAKILSHGSRIVTLRGGKDRQKGMITDGRDHWEGSVLPERGREGEGGGTHCLSSTESDERSFPLLRDRINLFIFKRGRSLSESNEGCLSLSKRNLSSFFLFLFIHQLHSEE